MGYLSQALGLAASTHEDIVAAEADAKIYCAAVRITLNLLVYLVIDDNGEAVVFWQRETVAEKVY